MMLLQRTWAHCRAWDLPTLRRQVLVVGSELNKAWPIQALNQTFSKKCSRQNLHRLQDLNA